MSNKMLRLVHTFMDTHYTSRLSDIDFEDFKGI